MKNVDAVRTTNIKTFKEKKHYSVLLLLTIFNSAGF